MFANRLSGPVVVVALGASLALSSGYCIRSARTQYQGKSLDAWVEQLKSRPSSEARRQAVDALIHIGAPAAPFLNLAFQGAPAEERLATARNLARVKDSWLARPLTDAYLAEDLASATASAMLATLSQVATDAPTTRFLISTFRRSLLEREEMRAVKAARALGAIGGEEGVLFLLQELSLRSYAAEVEGHPDIEPTALVARIAEAVTLRSTNAHDMVTVLRKRLTKQQGPDQLGGALAYQMVSERVVITLLHSMGVPALEPLVAALRDRDVRLRRFAALMLLLMHERLTDDARQGLALAANDPDDQVRVFAWTALQQLGAPEVKPQ